VGKGTSTDHESVSLYTLHSQYYLQYTRKAFVLTSPRMPSKWSGGCTKVPPKSNSIEYSTTLETPEASRGHGRTTSTWAEMANELAPEVCAEYLRSANRSRSFNKVAQHNTSAKIITQQTVGGLQAAFTSYALSSPFSFRRRWALGTYCAAQAKRRSSNNCWRASWLPGMVKRALLE